MVDKTSHLFSDRLLEGFQIQTLSILHFIAFGQVSGNCRDESLDLSVN